MGSAFVHGRIRLEVALDEVLVLVQHDVDFLLVLGLVDLLEVLSHFLLLVVESVQVGSSHCEHMQCQQLSQCTPDAN